MLATCMYETIWRWLIKLQISYILKIPLTFIRNNVYLSIDKIFLTKPFSTLITECQVIDLLSNCIIRCFQN